MAMRRQMAKRTIAALLVTALVGGADLVGWLRPLDHWLAARRMEATPRAPTGSFVLVDIDPRSIAGLGRWPWPRHVHADVIDALTRLGAADIAFDVDFSSPSTPDEDAALAAALRRAGGNVILAALDQPAAGTAGGGIHHNRPLGIFAANAWSAGVNIDLDRDGKLRRLSYATREDGTPLPSMAAMLAGGAATAGDTFAIDFGIRADRIDHVSVIDLLDGKVPPDRIAGRKAIVGATALELRDTFAVPVYRTMSGSLVEAMGAESILQGRALRRPALPLTILGMTAILALALFLARRRWRQQIAVLAGAAVLIEGAALAVQAVAPVIVATGAWLVLLGGLAIVTLLREIDFRRILLAISGTRAANAKAILDRVIADNFAGVLVIADDGAVIAASRSAGAILALAGGDLAGARADRILPPPLRDFVRKAFDARDGGAEPAEVEVTIGGRRRVLECVVTSSRLEGGLDEEGRRRQDEAVVCLTFSDVTERKEALDRIAFLARFDPLTGLPNRNQFMEQVAAALADASDGDRCAVLCIDLDRFKTVNDTLGHNSGNLLLRALAERLGSLAPEGTRFARLGGDDFAIVLAGPDVEEEAAALARRLILSATREAYVVEGHRLVVAMSIGIAVTDPTDGDDPLACLKRADTALYAAKTRGGNCYMVFENAMIAGLDARQQIEMEVWEAFERGQFEVAYQPQVNLADGRIVGAEALLRWRHPVRGFIPPAEFIPVIETIGLMELAGRFILERACRAAASWPEHVRIAVNVSSVQFTRDDLVALVAGTLQRTGLSPSRLELEITESWFMNETDALATALNEIHAKGVRFALDDFGTGYSSLSYIRKFPIDKIKIDRSFVTGLPHDHGSVAIVHAVAAMAASLGLSVLAEGIEEEKHIKFLRLLGIPEGQGYLFARPMAEADFQNLLAAEAAGAPVRLAS
jgi:diguanylate cyclase (GGDEF)-like protein